MKDNRKNQDSFLKKLGTYQSGKSKKNPGHFRNRDPPSGGYVVEAYSEVQQPEDNGSFTSIFIIRYSIFAVRCSILIFSQKKIPVPTMWESGFKKPASTYSPALKRVVPSAQVGLTSLFEMVRGGPNRHRHRKRCPPNPSADEVEDCPILA